MAYGYLSEQIVSDMIHRRTFLSGREAKPLTDNLTVEKLLGDQGILCLNDLAHEVYTVGPHFDKAVKIIRPFKLSAPVGHFEKKILNVHDQVEGKAGFIGQQVEEFLKKIL